MKQEKQQFEGVIIRMKIYKRALTHDEMLAKYKKRPKK